MKRKIFVPLFLTLALTISIFAVSSHGTPTITAGATEINYEKVACAKIENMLNLNNVFGGDFLDNEILVNRAAVVLKDYADEDGFIPENIVTSYIKDMYDIDLDITDEINADMPKKDGYVYLIPRGYTVYSHEIISTTEQDGYLTVISAVTVKYHDGENEQLNAKTVLVKNNNSSFGYNILNCELDFDSNTLKA